MAQSSGATARVRIPLFLSRDGQRSLGTLLRIRTHRMTLEPWGSTISLEPSQIGPI
jgi:hypothetical protein